MKINVKSIYLLGLAFGGWAYTASAAVPASEAQQLGTTLTQFGAQKAGSPDGAIPPYTGGIAAMTNLPTGGGPTTGYPDPFASEKPLFTITGVNMAQYASQLTPGVQAILQRYPEYHIDVYPTHRTASYPAWVLADSVKNATTAQEIANGDGVANAVGGVPFPIPQDGNQVIWNMYMEYAPGYCTTTYQNYLIDSSGGVTDLGTIYDRNAMPYYDPTAPSLGKFYRYHEVLYNSPVQEAGALFLFDYTSNYQNSDDVAWTYSPGTRRVRLAPEFKYDTPIAAFGGAMDYDEIDMLYGRLDKFDFKLVGEKEMIIPYNDYIFANYISESSLLGTHTLTPNGVRWERHRVWVVDGTLKAGARHSYSRWTLYIDEDSWKILASESYDHSGAIYRVGISYPYQNYSQTSAITYAYTYGIYDLSKGTYMVALVHTNHDGGGMDCSPNMPSAAQFTPQAMAQEAVR